MMENKMEGGIGEMRKEEEVNPTDATTYMSLASTLLYLHRDNEAMDEWRKLLKVDPSNRDAISALSSLLMQAHNYSEAVGLLETALKQTPDSTSLKFSLSLAYLEIGQKEKGLGLLQQAVAASPNDPMTLNNAAYTLADANIALDQAKEYGKKALHQFEEACNKTGASERDQFAATYNMSLIWDTVGWIDFRQGDLEAAAAY